MGVVVHITAYDRRYWRDVPEHLMPALRAVHTLQRRRETQPTLSNPAVWAGSVMRCMDREFKTHRAQSTVYEQLSALRHSGYIENVGDKSAHNYRLTNYGQALHDNDGKVPA